MGNRAIIKPVDMNIGLYLHWNGGRDSVEGFLKYCDMKGYRGLGVDSTYGLARLCQVISNFFGGSASVGVTRCVGTSKEAEMIDNGIYVVKGWNIVDRIWKNGKASKGIRNPEQQNYDLMEMLESIDVAQPVTEQLGTEYLHADIVPRTSLKVGDRVYLLDPVYEKPMIKTIVGLGTDDYVNGVNVKGIPYVDLYCDDNGEYKRNINNYLPDNRVRKVGVLREHEGK